MNATGVINGLGKAISLVQTAKSNLLSDYNYAEQKAEDRLNALSQDVRNERLMEHIINPATGSPFSDRGIQEAILNSQIRASEDMLYFNEEGLSDRKMLEITNPTTGENYTLDELYEARHNAMTRLGIANVEDRILELSLDPDSEDDIKRAINVETGKPYSDEELSDAIANAEARAEDRLAEEIKAREEEMTAKLGTVIPTGELSHGGVYAGQPLVEWTPPNQITEGYTSMTVAEAVVPFHAAVLDEFPEATVGSNYRSYEEQKYLYDLLGPYNGTTGAATPGTSKHESGLAIDYSIPQDDPHAYFEKMKTHIHQNIHPRAIVIIEVTRSTGIWHVHLAFPPTTPEF